MMASSAIINQGPNLAPPGLVKEGLLFKRAEKMRTWRPRYFYLFDDGSFLGFKGMVENPIGNDEHQNCFTVRGCQIFKMDRPKEFTFMIQFRGKSLSPTLERSFCTDSEKERQNWVTCIESVSEAIEPGSGPYPTPMYLHNDTHLRESVKSKVTFENFTFLKLLGQGTYGKVILCRDKKSGKLYAIKILRKDVILKTKSVRHTLTENQVLQRTKHPFIMSLKCSFQTDDRLCFVTQFVNGGDLYCHLRNEKFFTEERTKFYGAEIVSAIGYLHELGIIHRDLKPENILLDKDGHIKIADFGVSKDITLDNTAKTFCGSPEYLAPEMIEDTEYGMAVDWWAIGVIMYEMMFGRLPFYSEDHDILFELIVLQEVRFPPSGISPEAQNLLTELLRKDPRERLGASSNDVMSHVFFKSIDWTALSQRKIVPPFKPPVTMDKDYPPVEITPPQSEESLLAIRDENVHFNGFSYRNLSYRDLS